MRLLFTLNPQLGHLHPLVPFAKAAQRRGHDVLFATAARFGSTVLTDPSYRRNAEHVRDEIATLPDIDAAVGLLEHVALERTPPAVRSASAES